MAEATRSSFLGSISAWSRSSTPPPKSPLQKPKEDPPALRQSTGLDHTISLRPSPSLRKYPKDCPPLKPRWFYAVDVPKRKPFASESTPEEKAKPPPVPKKLVPFSSRDSQAIEKAFQSLDKDDHGQGDNAEPTSTKVPVNEDFLYDVHIEKRELEPVYWLGPVYDVRRGSWFYADGSTLKPCDENLANQLEEGYLKVAPWRRIPTTSSRSSSQPRSRPTSTVIDNTTAQTTSITPPSQDDGPTAGSNTHRLFGAYMNTTVTYQDATVAYLTTDDLFSRVSSTVYGRFVGYGGTKVVRGWSDTKTTDSKAGSKAVEVPSTKDKRKSANVPAEAAPNVEQNDSSPQSTDQEVTKPRRTALERQLSSLAGMPHPDDAQDLAEEEAREEEEREMEDAREKDGDDQARQIDHLVLVTHGIGQRLGLRLDSINFIHDVNTMRKTMKAVYDSAPDLQALSGDPKNCKIQVLPICWRHLLDFPKQSLKQNRKEFDLGDADAAFDDEYPSLQDITVEGVPAVRNLITDLAMDVLLYQSAYREHIATIVQKECNRVYQLFKARTGFDGKVSFCGHSLGSAILFDLLCRQEETSKTRPRRVSSRASRDYHGPEHNDLRLDFDVEKFFCLGSPIALFQMLKGRTIAGRSMLHLNSLGSSGMPTSPFDPDPMGNDPFDSSLRPGGTGSGGIGSTSNSLIPISVSSPKCNELFNIFHPTDPIAYRMEPLISPAMAQLKSQPLPYTKKGLFAAPGIGNMTARVGQQVMSSWYNLTSGVASSLINRSLGITGEEQALAQDKAKLGGSSTNTSSGNAPSSHGEPIPPAPVVTMPLADSKRQQDLAEAAAKSSTSTGDAPTLIDSEIETLYSGFQKRHQNQHQNQHRVRPRRSRSHTASTTGTAELSDTEDKDTAQQSTTEYQLSLERSRRLKREEAKVRALNSNGRVDYHIQEGMFDVSLLASIASHLSYWADEDVNHFMIGQMLKTRARETSDDIRNEMDKDRW
ncbi:putative phospholipase C20G8.02, mitochondrial [Exophiala dermatitidis]